MEQSIVVSLLTMQDVDFVAEIKSDPVLWPYEYDISTDKEGIRKTIIERMNSNWYKQYVIKSNNDVKTLVGIIFIHHYVEERRSWEIGFCILPEYQKLGYCFEAAKIVLRVAFLEWNAHKVVAMCNEYNVASRRVMEKLGMKREGIFREELPWNDGWANQYFFSILKKEYGSIAGE